MTYDEAIELAAKAGYDAMLESYASREPSIAATLPGWEAEPETVRVDWRAAAKAIVHAYSTGGGKAPPLICDVRHKSNEDVTMADLVANPDLIFMSRVDDPADFQHSDAFVVDEPAIITP